MNQRKNVSKILCLVIALSFSVLICAVGAAQNTPTKQNLSTKFKDRFKNGGWNTSNLHFTQNYGAPIMFEDHWLQINPDLKAIMSNQNPSSWNMTQEYIASEPYEITGLRIAKQDQPRIYFVVRTNGNSSNQIVSSGIRIYPQKLIATEHMQQSESLVFNPSANQAEVQKKAYNVYKKYFAQAKNNVLLHGFFGGVLPEKVNEDGIKAAKKFYAKYDWKTSNFNFYQVFLDANDSRRDILFDSDVHQEIFLDSTRLGLIKNASVNENVMQSGINYFFYSENLFKTKSGNLFAIDFCFTLNNSVPSDISNLSYAWLVIKPNKISSSGELYQKIFPADATKNQIVSYVDGIMKK